MKAAFTGAALALGRSYSVHDAYGPPLSIHVRVVEQLPANSQQTFEESSFFSVQKQRKGPFGTSKTQTLERRISLSDKENKPPVTEEIISFTSAKNWGQGSFGVSEIVTVEHSTKKIESPIEELSVETPLTHDQIARLIFAEDPDGPFGVSTVITYKPGEENQRSVEQVAVNTQLTKPEDALKLNGRIVFGQTTPNKHFFGGTSTVVKIKPGL